jgi:recombination protein RecR
MASRGPNSAVNRLVERLSRLPGIGRRSAERVVFYLLRQPADEAGQLAAAIGDLKKSTRACSVCGNIAESDPCPICADPERDHRQVLVVEEPNDVWTLEASGQYRGVYHVLMGRLAPLDGVGPGELNVEALLARVREHNGRPAIAEVIIGTNPTLEGDGTALYLAQELGKLGVRVSRLARGLPTGARLDMLSKAVLTDALQGRQAMSR